MHKQQMTRPPAATQNPAAESSDTQRILNLARLEYLKAQAREKFLLRQEAASQGWKGK